MPIAGSRKLIPNIATPRLDLSECVLYLPLWRPDMVANGGSIVSGTGTMAVTPLNLAVGANTVTALTAGTFIVAMPEGGAVASNGATISGSPVTIPAGIATSVTTGVTTGTFTCTPSNIIRSKDKNNRACTVTGALWTPQGRSFDGTDDDIIVGTETDWDTLLDGQHPLSFMFWLKGAFTQAQNRTIWGKGDDGNNNSVYFTPWAGTNRLSWDIKASTGVNSLAVYAAPSLYVPDSWQCWAGTYDGLVLPTGITFFLNGEAISHSTNINNLGANTVANDLNLKIGTGVIGSWDLNGVVGDSLMWNRRLTAAEMVRTYQATKWRYN